MQPTRWEIYLLSADVYSDVDPIAAEKDYRRALELAAASCGSKSAAVGLVLFDFAEFLEGQERDQEAEEVQAEIRCILSGYAESARRRFIEDLENCYQRAF